MSALFGWAIVALFGETSPRKKIGLSVLVGAAAAWPLLLIGVTRPRLSALVLAFVPLPGWVPAWIVPVVWIALALAVPLALGIAVAIRSHGTRPPILGTKPTARSAGGPLVAPGRILLWLVGPGVSRVRAGASGLLSRAPTRGRALSERTVADRNGRGHGTRTRAARRGAHRRARVSDVGFRCPGYRAPDPQRVGGAPVEKEIQLAQADLAADIEREIAVAKNLGIATLIALLGLHALLVTLALALAHSAPL